MPVFIEADGVDERSGTPLVRIHADPPRMDVSHVRNASGVADLRARPMWQEWSATVRVRFDADMIDAASVVNLLDRAGMQCGIGEGRPFSKKSNGCGWGTFCVKTEAA